MNKLDGCRRHDVLRLLDKESGAIGVELGVAAGGFSKRMVESGRFAEFFGVDMYADSHDTAQYKTALKAVGLHAPYKLLRMTFDEALDLFEDESLDFIYVDGYASSGQNGGKTIWDWSSKVRIGGVIAGDDYDPKWPLVKKSVDHFVAETGFDLHVTTVIEPELDYSDFPSWAVIKSGAIEGAAQPDLVARGQAAGQATMRKRARLKAWNRRRKKRRL